MKTLSYIYGNEEEIKVGNEYCFGQLWDGEGDGELLLERGNVSPDNENVVEFEIVEKDEDILKTRVKVINIF